MSEVYQSRRYNPEEQDAVDFVEDIALSFRDKSYHPWSVNIYENHARQAIQVQAWIRDEGESKKRGLETSILWEELDRYSDQVETRIRLLFAELDRQMFAGDLDYMLQGSEFRYL